MIRAGQLLTRWWQEYAAGRLRTPRSICQAARAENTPQTRNPLVPALDDGQWTAPERLKIPAFIQSTGYLSQGERADWSHVDVRLMYWAALVVEYARKRGIPLYVHTALRGREEQERLRKAGHSKAAYGRSAHNIGEAVDIVHGLYHWNLTKQEWGLIHVLGRLALERVNAQLPKERKLQLTWGGHFNSLYDPAHWEVTSFRERLRPLPDEPKVTRMPRAILTYVREGGLK